MQDLEETHFGAELKTHKQQIETTHHFENLTVGPGSIKPGMKSPNPDLAQMLRAAMNHNYRSSNSSSPLCGGDYIQDVTIQF